jgi:hypothetical protein
MVKIGANAAKTANNARANRQFLEKALDAVYFMFCAASAVRRTATNRKTPPKGNRRIPNPGSPP